MRIVSWNCNGGFRHKYRYIQECDADVYVIQECENPAKYTEQFSSFYSQYVWQGEKNSKGLGIFIRLGLKYEVNDWPTYCLQHFLSIKMENAVDIVGVWAGLPYIEEYYIYQAINIEMYGEDTVIIGDLNSNAQWDKEHRGRNHSAIVEQLAQKKLVSAYHYVNGEAQGCETQPTFYLYRHQDKSFHIDHCFVSPARLKHYQILNNEVWKMHSAHLPIQVDIYES